MPQQSSVSWLLSATLLILVFCATASSQPLQLCPGPVEPRSEVRLRDDSRLCPGTAGTVKRLPVLFVHGHNFGNPNGDDFNYRQNWQDAQRPSFKQTLELDKNAWLDIEDYYIRFRNQGRSISEDATDISDAIDLILHRHDTGYAYPHVAGQQANVKVVIIAYSKGTLSSRLFLKSLQEDITGMPPRRPGFNPVSEFIAISPPNHGIETVGTTCAGQQMNNGKTLSCNDIAQIFRSSCGLFPDGGINFITNLNATTEAPGSRPDLNNSGAPTSVNDGTLYVTIFANQGNPDFVGSDNDPGSCESRPMASNRSLHAENIPLPIAGGSRIAVHGNTPHTSAVICQALYAAAHHRSPKDITCGPAVNGKPLIPRAAVVLALDFSGSMDSRDCPGCRMRSEILQDSVDLFGGLWLAISDADHRPVDRLAATYFRSSVTRFPSDGSLLFLDDGEDDVIGDVRLQTPRDATAMGGALQEAIKTLKTLRARSPFSRVVLFTDGMQNRNPMVLDQSGQLVIDDQRGRLSSGISPTTPPTVLHSSFGVAVDTLGIGAGEAFASLLQDIALNTGGRNKITAAPDDALRQLFVEELIDVLRGSSPQLVAYRHGVVSRSTTETFAIEEGVRRLVLKLSWKRGESLSFKVTKDGVDVTSAGRFINGDFYKIFAIDLPGKNSLEARGAWQIQISGKANTGYEAAAIVDGSKINYDAMFDGKRSRAGDPLDLVVRLTHDGRPLSDATVNVSLFRPITTAGDLIAQKRPQELPSFEPNMTPGERQLLALMQDPKRLAALTPKEVKLVRKADEKGELRITFTPKVPGVYTARITITGEAQGLGRFSRTQTVTRVVRFANPDLKSSSVSAKAWIGTGAGRYVSLTVTPRDSSGHFLGPGLPAAITLKLSSGQTVGAVRDLGDGRYMLLIETLPGKDPSVTLEVAGDPLFTGPLSKLLKPVKK